MKRIALFFLLFIVGCSQYPTTQENLKETDPARYCASQFMCPADVCAVRPSYPHNDIQTCMTKEKAARIDATTTACANTGGTIRKFGGTCADDCQYERMEPFSYLCGQVMTWSCDCGPDNCWNGTACEPN